MRELDVLLGRWLDDRWVGASVSLRSAFEDILGREDDEIWDWLMGRGCPDASLEPLIEDIREHCVGPRYQ